MRSSHVPRHAARARSPRPRVEAAEFEDALREARRGRVDLGSSLSLFRGARNAERARELYAAASSVRDRNLGRKLELTAHIHMVSPCELHPSCQYCSLSSTFPRIQSERSVLSRKALMNGVLYAAARNVRSIVLVGGTDLKGSDEALRAVVEAVRAVTSIELAVDVGPSLAPETLDWLRDQNARTIYCSVETTNPRVFRRAKPGDDLGARLEFDSLVEARGMRLGNVVMNGLGRTQDLLTSILDLRRFPGLSHLYVSTFHAVRGTPWERKRSPSLDSSLRALAIARLALPKVHLGLAEVEVEDPGSLARLTSQLSAGGGNSLAGLLIYRNRRVDNLEQIRAEAGALGFAS